MKWKCYSCSDFDEFKDLETEDGSVIHDDPSQIKICKDQNHKIYPMKKISQQGIFQNPSPDFQTEVKMKTLELLRTTETKKETKEKLQNWIKEKNEILNEVTITEFIKIAEKELKKEIKNSDGNDNGDKENPVKIIIGFIKSKISEFVVSDSDNTKVFGRVKKNNHYDFIDLTRGSTKSFFKTLMLEETGDIFYDESYKTSLEIIIAQALKSGKTRHEYIYNRVAMRGDVIFYDLCTPNWDAVRIDSDGFKIISLDSTTPIFMRAQHQSRQIEPKQNFDSDALDKLTTLLRINDGEKILFQAHLVGMFIESASIPIMSPIGEQGTNKSTLCSSIKILIDPSGKELSSNLSTLTNDVDDLMIHVFQRYLTMFDNVTFINNEMSDNLCKSITGFTYPKRKLFKDTDEVLLHIRRRIGVNGIAPTMDFPDLVERTVFYHMDPIQGNQRLTDEEFLTKFNALVPHVLSKIFSTLSYALKIQKNVKSELTNLTRMADFMIWGESIARALGHAPFSFIREYKNNISENTADSRDNFPIVGFVEELMSGINGQYAESTTKFFNEAKNWASMHFYDVSSRFSNFPKAPNKLKSAIKRFGPILREHGYEILIDRYTEGGDRFTKNSSIVIINPITKQISNVPPPSPPSPPPIDLGTKTGGGTTNSVEVPTSTQAQSGGSGGSGGTVDTSSEPKIMYHCKICKLKFHIKPSLKDKIESSHQRAHWKNETHKLIKN